MKNAIHSDNIANFHHMTLYCKLSSDMISELWESATDICAHDNKIILYMIFMYNRIATEEKLLYSIEHHFGNVLSALITGYTQAGNKPFLITNDTVDKILKSTSDHMYKLELLNGNGFEIENYDKIKSDGEKDLPRPTSTRYVTTSI